MGSKMDSARIVGWPWGGKLAGGIGRSRPRAVGESRRVILETSEVIVSLGQARSAGREMRSVSPACQILQETAVLRHPIPLPCLQQHRTHDSYFHLPVDLAQIVAATQAEAEGERQVGG